VEDSSNIRSRIHNKNFQSFPLGKKILQLSSKPYSVWRD